MGQQSSQLQELAQHARDYCRTIHAASAADEDWLKRVAGLLSRIHAAVIDVEGPSPRQALDITPHDYDRRFELFCTLRELLGERDSYHGVGDTEEGCGSLADDLTDIYFELRYGLELLDNHADEPQQAAGWWRAGYIWHWGQHLVDAERYLYEMEVNRELARQRPVHH